MLRLKRKAKTKAEQNMKRAVELSRRKKSYGTALKRGTVAIETGDIYCKTKAVSLKRTKTRQTVGTQKEIKGNLKLLGNVMFKKKEIPESIDDYFEHNPKRLPAVNLNIQKETPSPLSMTEYWSDSDLTSNQLTEGRETKKERKRPRKNNILPLRKSDSSQDRSDEDDFKVEVSPLLKLEYVAQVVQDQRKLNKESSSISGKLCSSRPATAAASSRLPNGEEGKETFLICSNLTNNNTANIDRQNKLTETDCCRSSRSSAGSSTDISSL